MKGDFDMIVHKLPQSLTHINLYPLGDVHVGAEQFSEELFDLWVKTVLEDEFGYVVIVGDLLDMTLKGSKGNSYEAKMRPREQKAWLTDKLRPIKHKILGACRGNHEYRAVNEADDCPLYDVMAKLDIEDLYRENMAVIKVNLGFRNKERQHSYSIVLMHGQSDSKTEKFSYAIDGADIFVTGHTHRPTNQFPSKIVIDTKNEVVRMQDYVHIVVPSFYKFGGYALKGMYLPKGFRIPMLVLSGERKDVEPRWILGT